MIAAIAAAITAVTIAAAIAAVTIAAIIIIFCAASLSGRSRACIRQIHQFHGPFQPVIFSLFLRSHCPVTCRRMYFHHPGKHLFSCHF